MNFSYPFNAPTFVKALGRVVKVRGGKFDERHVRTDMGFFYFRVADIIYGDLTGDGRDEAVVTTIYGSNSGTFYLTNVYVYTLKNGSPVLLDGITDERAGKIYKSYYPDEWSALYEGLEGGRRVGAGKLIVRHYADGSHCCSDKTATFEYKWNGRRMELVRLLKREPSVRDEKMKAYYNR
ncbi:MAG TPA: hypothetical protein VF538_06885 [Pyrinomonadaceae bacterium]|jgi:hypothetical protein